MWKNKPNWFSPQTAKQLLQNLFNTWFPIWFVTPALSHIMLRKWTNLHFQYVIPQSGVTVQFLFCPNARSFSCENLLSFPLLFGYSPRILEFLSEHSPIDLTVNGLPLFLEGGVLMGVDPAGRQHLDTGWGWSRGGVGDVGGFAKHRTLSLFLSSAHRRPPAP